MRNERKMIPNKQPQTALRYVIDQRKALYLDLDEVMGNTGKKGLHLACLGDVWQSVVFGFAGLHIVDGVPQLAPHLPHGCIALNFKFFYRGQKYEAKIPESSWSVL